MLDRQLAEAGLATRIEVPEAARIDFLFADDTGLPARDDQLRALFGQARLQELPRVAPKVAGHGCFTTWPVDSMIRSRRRLREAVDATGPGLEYWMFVSPYDYKDGLVYVDRDTREVHDSKLLWALGNYSRFLRPGAVRVRTSRADGASDADQARGLMVSAFRAADGERPVVVAVNYGTVDRRLQPDVVGMPGGGPVAWQPYVTSAALDLAPIGRVEHGSPVTVPARSVVTLVGSTD